jgi:hypothetical protein
MLQEKKMDNQINSEFAVGDQVVIMEKGFSKESRQTTAKIIDVRLVLGKVSYTIETEGGKRRVVGASQVSRATE